MQAWEPTADDLDLSAMPPNCGDIPELLGRAAVFALIRWRGGCELSVPRRMLPNHPIVEALGEEAAGLLCRHYGGGKLSLPHIVTLTRQARNRAIRAAYDSGATVVTDLARRFGMSDRAVRRILNGEG